MIVLLGLRYYIMDEVTKIKRKIDFLLDRYPNVSEEDRPKLELQLRVQREKLKGIENGKAS